MAKFQEGTDHLIQGFPGSYRICNLIINCAGKMLDFDMLKNREFYINDLESMSISVSVKS